MYINIRKCKFIILIILLFISVSCEKTNGNADTTGAKKSDELYHLDKAVILQLINDVRSKGCTCEDIGRNIVEEMPPVATLQWSDQLAIVALSHSEDMQKRNYFSHVTPDGVNFSVRLLNGGYNFKTAAENIAYGYKSEVDVVNAWLKSYGHCKNIMNGSFKEMGVGRSNKDNYWTQLFASK